MEKGEWGRRQRRRRDLGVGGEADPAQNSERFPVAGSKPLHIPAALQTAQGALHRCLPAAQVRPIPALPLPSLVSPAPTPEIAPPVCVQGRGSCAGEVSGTGDGVLSPLGSITVRLRTGATGRCLLLFKGIQYNLISP